jgi:GTP-binding protein
VEKLFPAIDRSLEAFRRQLATAEVNRIFEEATTRHRPPSLKGKPWKLYYATQVSTGPPTFMLFANRTLQRTDTYRRYLENVLRETLGLDGVPVRLVIRPRTKTSAST